MQIHHWKSPSCACIEARFGGWDGYTDTVVPCAHHAPSHYAEHPCITPYGWFETVRAAGDYGYHVVLADGVEVYTWQLPIAVELVRDGELGDRDRSFCYSPENWHAAYVDPNSPYNRKRLRG